MTSTKRFGDSRGDGSSEPITGSSDLGEEEPSEEKMADRSGEVLDGRYALTRLIGEGGMGHVYEGEHLVTGRKVAVKLLHSRLSDNREAVKRFYREARAATAIGSDHICQVLDMRPPEAGAPFLVMEYLEGETLAERLRRGPLDPTDAVDAIIQVLDGLQAAHDAGIVHRDIKPDNVFLVARGGRRPRVKLVDFGISKMQAGADDSLSLTKAGTVLGTPQYMSPEQARGDPDLGPLTDLYAVGVILYEALTGRVPFEADTFSAIVVKIITDDPDHPSVRRPELPPELGDLNLRAFARNPEERFQSAREMAEALAVFDPDRPALSPAPPLGFSPSASGARAVAGAPSERPKCATETPLGWEGGEGGGRRRTLGIAAVSAAVLLVLGGAAFAVYWLVPGLRTRTTVLEVARIEGPPVAAAPASADAAAAEEGGAAAPAGDGAAPAPTVHVVLSAIPEEATISLDGEPLAGNPVEVGIPDDGGEHTVGATAPGYRDASRTFTGAESAVVLTLERVPPPRPAPGPRPRPMPRPTPTPRPVSPVQDPWAGGR